MYSLIKKLARRKREEWHTSRAELLLSLLTPPPGARVLDIGGNDGEFMARVRARADVHVTIADVRDAELELARRRGFDTVKLSEDQPFPFPDGAFDLVIANSVIEHVTAGAQTAPDWRSAAFERQRTFANELRRVGRSYFVQTPHRRFPIEAHTWLPFVGWLSHEATVKVVAVSDRYWVKYCGDVDWNLLADEEMRELFPEAHLLTETVVGLPKSLIAYHRG